MFCPKCSTQNLDGASFCRSCGANISLVPQALTGQLPQPPAEKKTDRRGRELTLDQAFKNAFMGVAFLLIAIVLSRSGFGRGWWFWLLLPAFAMMGTGIAQFIRVKEKEKRPSLPAPPLAKSLPEHQETFIAPAPSVTEGTTRHLGVEAPTRHLNHDDRK